MTTAMVPHWTSLDTAGMAAEAVAAFVVTVLAGSWLRERVLRWWQRQTVTATVSEQPRDTEPYDSPAWTTGAAPTREE